VCCSHIILGCRYAKDDSDLESLERDLNEETGWKLVHGDVFRPPAHRMLLAAVVGTGIQLVLLGLFVIMLTIMGTFYEVREGGVGARGGYGSESGLGPPEINTSLEYPWLRLQQAWLWWQPLPADTSMHALSAAMPRRQEAGTQT